MASTLGFRLTTFATSFDDFIRGRKERDREVRDIVAFGTFLAFGAAATFFALRFITWGV